ncbi:MAG: hypothetical protein K1X82_07355 [Bacteroidia bacterium]|nr:hypothetical protein [Bacteroidia bacterium]
MKRFAGFLCLLVVLIWFSPFAYLSAQHYPIRQFSVSDGMNNASVNHLFQDTKGQVWMATQGGGANLFDGKNFQCFNQNLGLSSNFLTYCFQSSSGELWLGSEKGVNRFQQGQFKLYGEKEGLCDGVVYSIAEDASGAIWFATGENGIYCFQNNTFSHYTTKEGLASNTCYSLLFWDEKLYIGTEKGLMYFENNHFYSVAASRLSDKVFFSATRDNNGNAWFGSTSVTLLKLNRQGQTQLIPLPPPADADFIGGLAIDKRGKLWLATSHGLLQYSPQTGKFKRFGKSEGLSVEAVQTVMVDYENAVWIGTLYGGVNVLRNECFVTYSETHGLKNPNLTCLLSYGKDAYLLGTASGLFLFQPGNSREFNKLDVGLAYFEEGINDLAFDPSGQLWICSNNGAAVFSFSKGNLRLKKEIKDTQGNSLYSSQKVCFDASGTAWIANYGLGLVKVDKTGKMSYVEDSNGITAKNILTLFKDHAGNLWIGSQDQGLWQMNQQGQFVQEKTLAKSAVWSITEDEHHTLYVGTGDQGIWHKPATDHAFKAFLKSSDGLSSDFVPGLVYDPNRHCLWTGGDEGFSKIYPTGKNWAIKRFGDGDGFNPVTINPNGLLPFPNGLLLGSVKGLVVYKPEEKPLPLDGLKLSLASILINRMPESLEQFKVGDSINSGRFRLELPYYRNNLDLSFNACTTHKVWYQFLLKGQDSVWTAPSQTGTVSFTNLKPGNSYELHVRCYRDSDTGIVSEMKIPILIAKPWWESNWFIILMVLFTIALVWGYIKWRENKLKEENTRLEQTIAERTEELREQKGKIEQTLEEKEGLLKEKEMLLKEIHHRVKNNLQTISSLLMLQANSLQDENAKKAIQESQSRVRSIALLHQKLYQSDGLETVEFSAFVQDLVQQIQPIYQDKSKEISIQLNMDECYLLIDKAIPMGLMVNEWITNSFKYAFNQGKAGIIQIQLKHLPTGEELKWELSYSDSGQGFEEQVFQQPSRTLGLKLIKLLSQQLGGQLVYQQKPSTFTFQFK